jgi:hypothetical protein
MLFTFMTSADRVPGSFIDDEPIAGRSSRSCFRQPPSIPSRASAAIDDRLVRGKTSYLVGLQAPRRSA